MKKFVLSIFSVLISLLAFSQYEGESIFYDSFTDNKNNWTTGSNSERTYEIKNGMFHFTTKTGRVNSKSISIDDSRDFMIEAKIDKVDGVQEYGYGLVWGREDSNNEFEFNISGNGFYQVVKFQDGQKKNLIPWKSTDVIDKWNGATNTLTIKRIGQNVKFYINNKFINEIAYEPLMGSMTGFIVFNNQQIAIHYLKVSYLQDTPNKTITTTNNEVVNLDNSNTSEREKISESVTNINENLTSIFRENFNNNAKDWSLGRDNTREFTISNGKLYFDHKVDDYSYINSQKVVINERKDFSIEAKFTKISGVQNNSYGLVWGRKDSQNQYDFTITANGYYEIMKIRNNNFEELKGWTKTPFINQGNDASNTLLIKKVGYTLKFYINDYFITSIPYQPAFGDYIGFIIYDQQHISIDYLDVSYINQEFYNSPPVITITEPALSRGFDVVPVKSLRVAGYADDTDGISKVIINGRSAKLNGKNFYTDIIIQEGDNRITVEVYDNKNKSATKTFTLEGSSGPIVKEKRLALIVGNAEYSFGGNLMNPLNDANDMESTLTELGFDVIKYTNCNQSMLKRAIDEFGRKLDGYDVGLFFYAGHGIQVESDNYLVPVDAKLDSESEVEYDCVKASRVLAKMESAGTKANLVILDACRDNPFERSWSRTTNGKGLAFMNAPQGSLIAYATSPGTTASDGRGSNGLYTSALLQHIKTPGLSIESVFKKVRTTVIEQSEGKQTPWESTSLTGSFYFKK